MKGKQNIIKGAAICFVWPEYCYFFSRVQPQEGSSYLILWTKSVRICENLSHSGAPCVCFHWKTKDRTSYPRSSIKSFWRRWKGVNNVLPGWLLTPGIKLCSEGKVDQSLAYILGKWMIIDRAWEFTVTGFSLLCEEQLWFGVHLKPMVLEFICSASTLGKAPPDPRACSLLSAVLILLATSCLRW